MRDFRRARAPLGALILALVALTAPAGAATEPTIGGCRLIQVPASSTLPAGTTSCPGVRPGAIVESGIGFCTFNFLFRGSDGRRYIGTAGHCILGSGTFSTNAGERTWRRGLGPWAKDASGRRIGEFAYAIEQDPKDFSLIRIDVGVPSNPQMCFFGGPIGVSTASTGAGSILHHFGNGVGVGDVLPARSAIALSMSNADHIYAYGAVVPGDSGSGLIADDGRALGVIVTTGVHFAGLTDTGTLGATRIGPQIARAAQKLGIRLTLMTAPLATS